ncbi:MAG: thiamine diphosphokinase [Lachnospiraceae bacterium]|nr:thiamine diphosphokinase [Lachnospiraceae bacterium]
MIKQSYKPEKEYNNINIDKKCLIISGGRFANIPRQRLRADYVIACDKGLEYAEKYLIKPDVIVGDFDSVSDNLREGLDERDALIMRYPKEKDDTDTLIAVKYALSEGYRNIIIVCALGNRTDHLLANLQTAHYAAKKGAIVRFIDEYEEIIAFSNTETTIKKEIIDNIQDQNNSIYLSVFSLDDRSEGVSITGTKYEITDAVLTNTFPIGVSNEFKDKEAAISVKNGSLLVMITVENLL